MTNNQQQNQVLNYDKALKEAKRAVKSLDKRVLKTVPKGTQYDWLNNTSYNNVVYPRNKIPDRLLRLVETRNPIVGSIIKLRSQQAVEFSSISHDKDVPGWEFALKDEKATMNSTLENQQAFLEYFMLKTHVPGYQDFIGIEGRHDSFRELIIKFVRDRILIDKITWEIERDRKGQAVALWCLDGGTIAPVLPGGFYGSTSQIGVGIGSRYNNLSEEIRKARIEAIPPVEEIAYVQELIYGTSGGGIIAAFRESDLIYDLGNELNDIYFYKQGLSDVEKANIAVVAFMNSLTYNSNGLSRGSIPKIAIAMGKDSSYTPEQLEDAQDEWMANFQDVDGQWNIPLLNSDAKVLTLNNSNRDMEYQKYLEFTGALTCAVMGVDSSEIGLRLNQAQSVLSENQDAKQLFSKNRGLREMLGGFAFTVNRFVEISGFPFAQDWVFRFNGLSTEDRDFEANLKKNKAETYMLVDEIRAEDDLPPLKDGTGQVILNSVWQQNKQAAEMAAQQSMEEEEEGEFDEMAEDAMADLEKAIRII
jgi:hypothetical protein